MLPQCSRDCRIQFGRPGLFAKYRFEKHSSISRAPNPSEHYGHIMALPFKLKTTRIYQSAIFFVFAAMLSVSWWRWTSPIADSGREMDLPLRLINGELLYRDIH